MNETLKTIGSRISLRKYSDQPLSQEVVDTIVWAAMRAPTAGNMMLYSIIQVDDPKKKRMLAKTCDNQPFIAEAPLVLLFLADMQRLYDVYAASGVLELCEKRGTELRTPKESDLLLACCDALVAAQNAVIAAESLGIGSCYIGDIMENSEIHHRMFDLPKLVFPITLVCFGYHSKKERKLSPRIHPEYIHFKDRYKRFSSGTLKKIFEPIREKYFSKRKSAPGAGNIGQHFYTRKTAGDFSLEMERSVKKAIHEWLSYDPLGDKKWSK